MCIRDRYIGEESITLIQTGLCGVQFVSQQLSFLQQQLQRKQFVAVGEAGLDKLAKAPMELQLAVFKEQMCIRDRCTI